MNLINFLIMILVMSVFESVAENTEANGRCANVKAPLDGLRKRRHLTFPSGSAVVLTLSLVKTIVVHAPSGWNLAVEIDVMYPIPNPEMTNAFFRKKLHHRQKREFWETLETALASYNLDGRSCIYRSICEAQLHLAPPGRSLVHDILRSIFSAPVHEDEFKNEVKDTYEDLLGNDVCKRNNECPISLIEIILALNKNR